MAIEQWHPGQLVVLWLGAVLVELLIFALLQDAAPSVLVTSALIVFVAIPFVLLAITWRWFGARARR